jgi:hypothetical protein
MKRWAVLVVVLYLLALLALTGPLVMVGFYHSAQTVKLANGETVTAGISRSDVADIYFSWGYWGFLAVMAAGQAAMLLAPVSLTLQRPTARRSVLWPILVSGLMTGLLVTGAGVALYEFIKGEGALWLLDKLQYLLVVVIVVWGGWSIVFYKVYRDAAPRDVITRQCRCLLRGSILELLVAVPTHIVARSRDYCCAGYLTFLGIAFGVSVMLLSFGPGLYFLFAARWKKLQPQI